MYRPAKPSAARNVAMIGVAALLAFLAIETIATTAHRSPTEHWTQKSVAEARVALAAKAERARVASQPCECPLVAQAAP